MIVHIIHCRIPKGKATISTTTDDDVYVIAVNKHLTDTELRNELAHELLHIVNDDFNATSTATKIEKIVRQKELSNEELESINFYHHYLDDDDEVV